jgi:hypothetical protein
MKTLILITLTTLFMQCNVKLPPTPPPTTTRADSSETLSSDAPCDPKLWAHTYGAMERFGDLIDPAQPGYRKVLKHRCVTVRGLITSGPTTNMDGDVKWKIQIDPLTYMAGFYKEEELLDPDNHGVLAVELVCATKVTNLACANCVKACKDFKARYDENTVKQFAKGKWIDVTGELITDTGAAGNPPRPAHGGKEIHPVTSIKLVNY